VKEVECRCKSVERDYDSVKKVECHCVRNDQLRKNAKGIKKAKPCHVFQSDPAGFLRLALMKGERHQKKTHCVSCFPVGSSCLFASRPQKSAKLD